MTCMRRIMLLVFLLATARVPLALASPEIPGAPQKQPVALVGATIYPVSGPAIQRGTLLFDAGRITAVGRKVRIPAGARRIDVPARVLAQLICGYYGFAEAQRPAPFGEHTRLLAVLFPPGEPYWYVDDL